LEGLIDEEEDLIFETKLEPFSIGTITISKETISLFSVRVSEAMKNLTRDIKLGSSKNNGFNNTSLEDKVYPKT